MNDPARIMSHNIIDNRADPRIHQFEIRRESSPQKQKDNLNDPDRRNSFGNKMSGHDSSADFEYEAHPFEDE